MLKRLAFSLGLLLFVSACGSAAVPVGDSVPFAPRGAAIGADGYATILDAPPAPYTPAVPGTPPPPTAKQIAAQKQFDRAGKFQNAVMDEVLALGETLRTREKGNFVDLYFENEGEPHVVFRFLHDPEATLRKYTADRRFVAATAEYSMEELRAAMDFMFATFGDDRVIQGGGIGNKQNRAEIDINVPEAQFRALVSKKGVKIPAAVELHFATDTPASAINTPLATKITPLVRIFPRSDRPAGILHAIESRAKIVLRDGCFRIMGGDNDGALVLFPLGAQLFVDDEGFLAYGAGESPGYSRVGETIVTPGSIAEISAPDLVEPIRAACGAGAVVEIHGMRSAAADRKQSAATSNANALRDFRQMYGLTEAQARKALEECKKTMGVGACILSPPPPHMSNEPCPQGTDLSGGLCRTPEGYIRPLPNWLKAIVGEN